MDEIKLYAFQILDATLKKGLASYAAYSDETDHQFRLNPITDSS
jgi:hypothetical protein